mgnify:CR=1 FL=1
MSESTKEKVITEEEFLEHELTKKVEADSELKTIVLNYIGNKHQPENDEITLEMIIETFAQEFPEFLLPIAEENFIRGYQQALTDIDQGETFLKENGIDDATSFEEFERKLQSLENSDDLEND